MRHGMIAGFASQRVLGMQFANVHLDLAVATRLLRTRQTIDIALHGRQVPVLIGPDFDELRGGDLDGGPIEAYRSWRNQHSLGDRLPHGESPKPLGAIMCQAACPGPHVRTRG